MINPGLAPWALKKCRPCRAFCGLIKLSICRKLLDFLGDAGMSAFRHDTFS